MKLMHLAVALAAVTLVSQDGTDGKPQVAKVGEAAPAFRLNDQDGKAVQIGGESELWTVVAFFPKAMTPG